MNIYRFDISENVSITVSACNKYVAEWKFLHIFVPLYCDVK